MPETPQIPASPRSSQLTTPETNSPRNEATGTAYVSELRAARAAGVRWRRIARWLGLGIFVLGALLLVYVFWVALSGLQQYSKPDYMSNRLGRVTGDTVASTIQGTVAVFGTELLRVLYLLILGFIASAVAARGIQFFAASEAIIDEAVLPEDGA